VKAMKKTAKCFRYLIQKFPLISDAKIKEAILVDVQIEKVTNERNFYEFIEGTAKT
jgi:hypothetical protein